MSLCPALQGYLAALSASSFSLISMVHHPRLWWRHEQRQGGEWHVEVAHVQALRVTAEYKTSGQAVTCEAWI